MSSPVAMEPASKWEETLRYETRSDPHVTGKHGFDVYHDRKGQVVSEKVWSSGLDYSTLEDAEAAADAVCHVAWLWRNR